MSTPEIDTADHVYIECLDETWLVAMVEGGRVTCCGWPESTIEVDKCELLEKATEAERLALLRDMAASSGRRLGYAQRRLKEILGS